MTSHLEIINVLNSEREEGIAAQGNLLMELMEGIHRMEQSHTRPGTRGKSDLSQAEPVGGSRWANTPSHQHLRMDS